VFDPSKTTCPRHGSRDHASCLLRGENAVALTRTVPKGEQQDSTSRRLGKPLSGPRLPMSRTGRRGASLAGRTGKGQSNGG